MKCRLDTVQRGLEARYESYNEPTSLFKIPIVASKRPNKLEKSSSYPIESRLYTLRPLTSRRRD